MALKLFWYKKNTPYVFQNMDCKVNSFQEYSNKGNNGIFRRDIFLNCYNGIMSELQIKPITNPYNEQRKVKNHLNL
jgi:hypothetical protein